MCYKFCNCNFCSNNKNCPTDHYGDGSGYCRDFQCINVECKLTECITYEEQLTERY